MNQFYTAESVTEGHPDKIADQISDSILDAIMEKDPMGRVAFQTLRRVRLRVSLVHGDPKAAQFPSCRPGGRKD